MKLIKVFILLLSILPFTLRAEKFMEDTVYVSKNLQNIEIGSLYNDSDTSSIYRMGSNDFFRYTKPNFFDFAGNTFQNLCELPGFVFRKEAIVPWSLIAASTGLLYYYDKELLDAAQQFGRFVGIPGEDNRSKNILHDDIQIYVPDDIGYAMYYIGDGFTEMGINLGFYIYGYATGDKRAMNVASQLTEGLATVGIVVQTLKRTTGRQSPFTVDFDTEPKRGMWRPFPNQFTEYQQNVPSYDAFPSGHLATAMMTLTILSENYQEYKWIKPVGYSLMTILGFQMLNNGVHWASDYPLAFGIGYSIGQLAVIRGRRRAVAQESPSQTSVGGFFDKMVLTPLPLKGGIGLGMMYKF